MLNDAAGIGQLLLGLVEMCVCLRLQQPYEWQRAVVLCKVHPVPNNEAIGAIVPDRLTLTEGSMNPR